MLLLLLWSKLLERTGLVGYALSKRKGEALAVGINGRLYTHIYIYIYNLKVKAGKISSWKISERVE